jgi:hypothetical protein
MSTPSTDNCSGDAQLPSCPEDLANRLRQLRKERHDQDRLTRMRSRARAEQRPEILNKTGSRCHICGGEIPTDSYWEADHVYPEAAGGDSKTDNFLAAHGLCNTAKWDHRGEEFQWVLKIGVWAKKQMEGRTVLGQQMLQLFWEREQQRVKRQKAYRKSAEAV